MIYSVLQWMEDRWCILDIMIYFGVTVDERSMVYIRHHDLYFWLITYSTTVVDLKLVIYSINNSTAVSTLLLLKTKNNLFFIILVMISFTELLELTLLFLCFSQERRKSRGLAGEWSDGPSERELV